MRLPAAGADLSGWPAGLAVLLALYLVLGQPLVSASSARSMLQALGSPGRRRVARARLDRYRRTLVWHWTLVVLVAGIVLAAGGLRAGDLGLRWPRGGSYAVVGWFGLAASLGLLVLLGRRLRPGGVPVRGPAAAIALVPRTPVERRLFALVAGSAGVCEETLYRGFLLAVLATLGPGLGPAPAVVLAAAGFGVAHAYQGVGGVLSAAVVGGYLGLLLVGTGSLLLPVLYHVLLDLRLLLLPVEEGIGERTR